MRALSLFVGLAAAAVGCVDPAVYQSDPRTLDLEAFGTIGDGSGETASSYGPRLGPAGLPWRDVHAGSTPSLTTPMPRLGAGEPWVVIDRAGVFPDRAVDLPTGEVLWQNTDLSLRFGAPPVSDGTIVCGPSSTMGGGDVICLRMSNGSLVSTAATGMVLTTGASVDLELRNGVLYVAAAEVQAFDAQTGARLFRHTADAFHRALTFVGADLVVEQTSGCGASAGCLAAIHPRTGAVHQTFSSTTQLSLLWQRDGQAFFHSRHYWNEVVRYDSANKTFTDVSTEFASFFQDLAPYETNTVVRGLSDPAADGAVFGSIVNFSNGRVSHLCRWNAGTRALQWCVPANPATLRAHPDRIYVRGATGSGAANLVLDSASGVTQAEVPFRFFFSRFAVDGASYYEVR